MASSKTYGRLCPCRTNPLEICPSEAVTTFVLLLVGGDGEDWRENSNFLAAADFSAMTTSGV